MRTYEFRLYPNKDQRRRLMECLYQSRQLYNEMLEREKQYYQETGKFLSKYDLTALFTGRGGSSVPASTVQCLADRLNKALKTYLKHKDDGWGFPRFKSSNQWHSIHLRQLVIDFVPEGRMLKVPAKLGAAIKMKRHREMDGTPQTCHLVLRADGRWYALIVYELPAMGDLSHPADDRPAIGIDVGLKVFLADSEGNTVGNPRYYRTSQVTLRRKQRRLCARKKGSRRRRKMARSVAQTHLKIERQRRDFHRIPFRRKPRGFSPSGGAESAPHGGIAPDRWAARIPMFKA
ncbi:MAG: RNA-guided endonuclease TnpB family protein [Chloroflexales bacterium]|nr:RNA-guided endonuclease TnpB family protein [Chloroflexales bacterium]